MSQPTLVYDAVSGSYLASGAGPGISALQDAHTAGVSNTVIQFKSNPDLSQVTPLIHALYLKTGDGVRKLSKILAVDDSAKTVTVEDTFTIAADPGVDWAIGFDRLDFKEDTGLYDWSQWKAGWTVQLKEGDYNQNAQINVPSGSEADGRFTLEAHSSVTSRPIVRKTTGLNAPTMWMGSRCTVKGVRVQNDINWSGAYGFHCTTNKSTSIVDCEIVTTGSSSGIYVTGSGVYIDIYNCYFHSSLNAVYVTGNPRITLNMIGCYVENISGSGVDWGSSQTFSTINVTNCIFNGCPGNGLNLRSNQNLMSITIYGNTFYRCYRGVRLDSGTSDTATSIVGNLFVESDEYGLYASGSNIVPIRVIGYNGFHDNVMGPRSPGVPVGEGDVELQTGIGNTPFVDAPNGDFALNDIATGGDLLKEVGFPQSFGLRSPTTVAKTDIGAVAYEGTGGGPATPPPDDKTEAYENDVLETHVGNQAPTFQQPTYHVALLTAITDRNAGTVTELVAAGYTRQAISTVDWSAAAGGQKSNNTVVDFGLVTGADWTGIVGIGISTASSGGTWMQISDIEGADVDPITVPVGSAAIFEIGDLLLKER